MFDLSGKVALFAGGAGYLGLPASQALAEQGAKVMVASRKKGHVEEAVEEIGERAAGTVLDLADEQSIHAAITRTVERFGRLDVVVNYTYASTARKVDELTAEEFDRANRVNVTGSFLLARAAADAMKEGGSIIMCASMYGLVSPDPRIYEPPMNPNPIEYGAGKAAMCQMVRYLAAAYGPRGIRVNAIAPGPFPYTEMAEQDPAFIQRLADKTMLGRVGARNETAGAVVFLASDEAAYVTGMVLRVDGGWTAW